MENSWSTFVYLALCRVSLCMHFIITAKGNDLAGRESLVNNSCSPCHLLLCVSPFPLRPLLAKPAERGFAVSMEKWSPYPAYWAQMETVKKRTIYYHFAFLFVISPQLEDQNLVLFCISVFLYLYLVFICIIFLYLSNQHVTYDRRHSSVCYYSNWLTIGHRKHS